MVLDLVASAVHYVQLPVTQFALVGVGLAAVFALRRWSAAPRCTDRRALHDKTFILVGCWSGPGLHLLTELAWAGAQCILLHPEPESPQVVQLLLLLRHSTANERIYAERCDMRDVGSIRQFAKGWEAHGRSGMMGDLEQRIEAVVFADGDGCGARGGGIRSSAAYERGLGAEEGEERVLSEHWSALTARHAFLQLMLPALLKSSASTPTRIIAQLSPTYAAGAGHILSTTAPDTRISSLDLDFTRSAYPSSSPWLAEGSAALGLVVLLREFQRRVDLGPSRANGAAGLVVLFACGGFTRQWVRRMLRAEWRSDQFSWAGYVMWLAMLPLILVFARSAEEAAQELVRCAMGDVRGVAVVEEEVKKEEETGTEQKTTGAKVKRDEAEAPRSKLRRGALYRDAVEVRIPALEKLSPTLAAELWESESKLVEGLVAKVAAKEDKEKEGAST